MRQMLSFLSRNKGFFVFMLGMLMFRSALADWNVVPTGSMQPTIQIGDRILVDKAAYDIRVPFTHVSLIHLADPQRGDIVVLDSRAANEKLVKRVIGIPGDVVAMRNNVLYINGVAAHYASATVTGIHDDLQDPALYQVERAGDMQHLIRLSLYRPSEARDFGPVTVLASHYLLLGDNRDNSMDSRYFGFFPRNEIVGRSRYVALSLDPDHHYLPRAQRLGARLDSNR
ncbi:signal peptidase I [Dyella nitratireducens]|uniref:Signal peptidase I n=1 Tax=Dyella nitratireducens TaxID=1849580 RepID=A0ABQ1FJ22_9GAMM|nr:signal peptidase I [Dyella nitratireducens]GGA17542.1 signal peptidase I [Dyella nitratireducens]GLQ44777.1 signal peptidase I [Dyella nitratireducens]